MIELVTLQNAVQLSAPRRVRRYVLIWCQSGRLTVSVDGHDFELHRNSVITITSGQVHSAEHSTKATKGWVMEFTYDFFCKDDNDIELIFHNSLFCHFAMNEVIELGQSRVVKEELETVAIELRKKPYQYLLSIHSRIELILVAINRAKLSAGGKIYKPDALFLKFLEALIGSFEKRPAVRDLARLLSTTESKLNGLSKLHTGRTAQSVINGLVASEAKRLLTYERLSVKEAAYRLGFNDPFYFSKFFKQQTGISPKSYQVQLSV